MLGAIIGDIAGSKYEFNNATWKDYRDKFNFFGGGHTFTDDTICTVAIADALLLNPKDPGFEDCLLYWCLRYPSPMGGYGASFNCWLNSPEHHPYNSWGNGSAMRVSSIGLLIRDETEVIDLASASAEVTHNHPKGIIGAIVSALGCYYLRGEDKRLALQRFISLIEHYYKIPQYEMFSNQFNESCERTIPVAASCFLGSGSFENAIRRAVFVGGDSDTIAAIVGGWAEAYYGVPEEMANRAIDTLPRIMADIVKRFYKEQNRKLSAGVTIDYHKELVKGPDGRYYSTVKWWEE